MDKQAIEALRLRLLENGYTPLPNVDKRCMVKSWPSLHVDADKIRSWSRIHGLAATGLRVENGMLVIDVDTSDKALVAAIANMAMDVFPVLADADTPWLVRRGKGYKEAWFFRCEAMFGCIRSYKYIEPGKTAENGRIAFVEMYNGGSARQFGAFGPHTRAQDAADGIGIDYQWADLSPLDVTLADLPALPKDQLFEFVKRYQQIMKDAGWQQVLQSESGENVEARVYDLTDDMEFQCSDDVDRTLDELREWAKAEEGGRCSASWLEGPSAKRRDRCLVSLTRAGFVAIYETASGVTHIETAGEPAPEPEIDFDRLAELMQELTDRRRNRLNAGDDYNTALVKALASYAWCPPAGLVVPLWPSSVMEGEKLASFRIRLMKHGYRDEPGPRGGRGAFLNPVDAWAQSDQLMVVEGVQMRPDQPRPTFVENGKKWVNAYRPAIFLPDDVAKGDPEPGFDFLRRLFPEPAECKHVMQWIAYKLRYPWVPMHALVSVAHGVFGTGRNTLGDLLGLMLGETYVREVPFENFTGRTYQSQYNDWQADTLLVVVSESNDADGSQWQAKRNAYERLKLIVDPRPGRMVLVNRKGPPNFYTRTCTSYLIATNHADALPIPVNDRRFCVVTNGEPQPPHYWTMLRRWMAVQENLAAFSAALLEVDLAGFDPFNPPLFEGKLRMAAEGRSDLDEAITIALDELPGEVLTVDQVHIKVGEVAKENGLDLPHGIDAARTVKRAITKQLIRLGDGVDVSGSRLKEDGRKHLLFVRTPQAKRKWSDADAEKIRREARRFMRLDGRSHGENHGPGGERGTAERASEAVAKLRDGLKNR